MKFCPHCGKANTLEAIAGFFYEQGEYNGKEYKNEGNGTVYQCTNCQKQCAKLD